MPNLPFPHQKSAHIHTCRLRSPAGTLGEEREGEHSSDMVPDLGKWTLDIKKAEGLKVQNLAYLLRNDQALGLYASSNLPSQEFLGRPSKKKLHFHESNCRLYFHFSFLGE